MPTMMRDAAISFPMLGDWSIDPSASFTLFCQPSICSSAPDRHRFKASTAATLATATRP